MVGNVSRLVSKDSHVAARQRASSRYVVLTWGADSAKEYSVVLLKLIESALGNILPGLLICVRAPVETSEVDVERPQRF